MNTKTDFKAEALERFKAGSMQSRAIRAEERAEEDFTRILLETESPIEAMFLSALFEEGAFDDAAFRQGHAHKWFGYLLERTEICAQYRIDNYRCDFALWHNHRNGTMTRILIECDGHEFHDRTKEQAQRDKSRDRHLTAKGWRVLRFTGSEIYRNAEKCAEEVAQILENEAINDWRLANG
jgi:very-short-patch-repair endonuclease